MLRTVLKHEEINNNLNSQPKQTVPEQSSRKSLALPAHHLRSLAPRLSRVLFSKGAELGGTEKPLNSSVCCFK